uniref:Nidogen-1-like n=1 Tax=Saccoglossus kowalevskii TaxID=10224 RepID=A0ABM0M8G8_SACKO|nr:PREDICTED: nidogen-1-like [Saccoglossus kowalevskii]
MERIDLHSYAVTNDGRSFTAVSRVPISIGYSMQALQPLGAVIGWVFAMTASKGKNGFGLTGGIFTRTADISFGSGERVTVKERFTGIDELGYMRMTAELDGTLPAIPPSTDITIEDYKETYTRLSPGRIRSSAERTLLIGEDPLEVNIDQTIEYEECIGDARQQANLIKAMRVSVTRNYVIYDRNEQILRYAMTSKVAPSTEPVYDPCLNNECHDKADCIVRGESYLCQCQTGFAGNGRFCDDIDECISGVSDCDSKANCVNQVGSFYCTCLPGYTGDGKTCKREDVSPSAGAFLLFAQGMGLYRLPLNDYEIGGRVVMKPRQIAIGVCYDCRDEFFYWTDVSNRRIYKSRYNGDDTEVVINSGLSSPEGIAIDWISRNMYWTDSGHDTIEVAYLNGLNQRVIISDGLVNPRAIAVDPVGSYLYWTDWNRDSPKIETSNLDGSERRVLVNTGLGLPNGLTLDSVNHQICWADAGEKKVECIGQTGNPDTRYVVTSEASQPFGLTNVDNQLYWTDWERDNIGTVSINGGNLGRPMQTPVGANGKLYGITAVTTCPQGKHILWF